MYCVFVERGWKNTIMKQAISPYFWKSDGRNESFHISYRWSNWWWWWYSCQYAQAQTQTHFRIPRSKRDQGTPLSWAGLLMFLSNPRKRNHADGNLCPQQVRHVNINLSSNRITGFLTGWGNRSITGARAVPLTTSPSLTLRRTGAPWPICCRR